jgi:molybdate transport system substrate-binding protein
MMLNSTPIRRLASGLAAGLLALAAGSAQATELIVSGAASLTNAFAAIGPAFEAQHPGMRVRFNFASSDALLQQVAKGAPVDVLASADQDTMNGAATLGLIAAGSRHDFATNRLVLVVPRASPLVPKTLGDLAQPAIRRIALGNPASVPAGRYAEGALKAARLWTPLQPRFVPSLSVRQALDYVARDEVDAAFVYATDAALRDRQVRVAFTVPTTEPIDYPIATVAASPKRRDAQAFIAYVLSPDGQAILAQYGFAAPKGR